MLMPRFASLRRRAALSLLERSPPVRVIRRDIGRTLAATNIQIDAIGLAAGFRVDAGPDTGCKRHMPLSPSGADSSLPPQGFPGRVRVGPIDPRGGSAEQLPADQPIGVTAAQQALVKIPRVLAQRKAGFGIRSPPSKSRRGDRRSLSV
jgi:hypothetical protein